jgi:FKBP-type peptidyl-prolyl cis-trans isomerase
MDKVNYGIGVEVIRNYKNQGTEIDLDQVIKGMKDGLSGQTLIPEKELRKIMTAFQTELRQRKSAKTRLGAINSSKKDGEYVTADKAKEREVTLPK